MNVSIAQVNMYLLFMEYMSADLNQCGFLDHGAAAQHGHCGRSFEQRCFLVPHSAIMAAMFLGLASKSMALTCCSDEKLQNFSADEIHSIASDFQL